MNNFNNNKFHFKKSFSQNFLNDEEKLIDIVNFSNININDYVLEIGPGNGALTKYLSENSKQVVCIELDKTLIDILNKNFQNTNVHIINKDFLTITNDDIINIFSELGFNDVSHIKVVSNIPYNITSPIIQKLLSLKIVDEFTLLVQKEVADRIIANESCKDYGILTISIKLFADVIEGFVVDKTCFYPVPKVDSKVVRIVKKNIKYDENFLEKFFNIVHSAFNQRRKTIINSLTSSTSFDKETILSSLHKLNISELSRAENLKITDYINLTNDLYNSK